MATIRQLVERADVGALVDAASAAAHPELPDSMTPALRESISGMSAVLDDAVANPVAVCGARSEQWSVGSRAARSRVVRMSLEMRMVVELRP